MAERMELTRPVFFVGFMGAGKTSVARRLARTCGVASVDMDTYIERREGKKVKEIFAEGGEEGFRAIETDVLRELGAKPDPTHPAAAAWWSRRPIRRLPRGRLRGVSGSDRRRGRQPHQRYVHRPLFQNLKRPGPATSACRCTRRWPTCA
ncbi:MAG: shikimate kinase [Coriobacteriaceae bacterium]